MLLDPYKTLGVSKYATLEEIKLAYRELVKVHHPDAGGDKQIIVDLNAAWEILGDLEKRKVYDNRIKNDDHNYQQAQKSATRSASANEVVKVSKAYSSSVDNALFTWLNQVYIPVDRLLGKVINALPRNLRALSADPYDDNLMEDFTLYLQESRNCLNKVDRLYRSMPVPFLARGFGLNLYHCYSLVQDGLSELERYTMGYVDSYLSDGREMFREAKIIRLSLKEERQRLDFS